jgi:predicted esterase
VIGGHSETAPGSVASAQVGDVHRWVAGTSPATLLLLHGTGGDEDDLLPLGRELAPAASLLSPRGPVLEQGMPRFFRRLALGVFDQEDLRRRTAELADFLRDAGARYGFDPDRVFALGYSNGANLAASLLLRDGGPLAGAALLRPTLPFEPDEAPRLRGKPILVAAGRRDPYAPVERVDRLIELFELGGARVEAAWSDAGHGLEPPELERVAIWLRRHI